LIFSTAVATGVTAFMRLNSEIFDEPYPEPVEMTVACAGLPGMPSITHTLPHQIIPWIDELGDGPDDIG